MRACSLIPLSEDRNSSVGIVVFCPKGVPVWEGLATLGVYFTGILLRQGAASGNWRRLRFGGRRAECDVQSLFRRLADEHIVRESGKFCGIFSILFKNRWTLVELGSLIFEQNFL